MKKIISILALLAVIGVAAAGFMFMSYNNDVKGGKGSRNKDRFNNGRKRE